jgi:hypothetical protein
MTITETYKFLKMLLDDARFYFVTKPVATRLLNEAQMRIVRKAHLENDERCLRPLYRRMAAMANGLSWGNSAFTDGRRADFLFPRSCIWHRDVNAVLLNIGETLNYQEPEMFFSHEGELTGRTRQGIYTVRKGIYEFSTIREERNFFYFTNSSPTNYASITYIRYPLEFGDNPLEVPQEYHPAVITLAAELANDLDVNENDRGQPMFQNQQLSLEGSGATV